MWNCDCVKSADLQPRDVMSEDVAVCGIGHDVQTILKTMKKRSVRRLSVFDVEGCLAGIISLNDLAMRPAYRSGADVSGDAFLDTMKNICAHSREAVNAWLGS
jgi:CBS-domain-containing membrane protein